MSDARIPFMPPLNSLWVFKHDLVMPHSIISRYGNDMFEACYGLKNLHVWLDETGKRNDPDWVPQWHAFNATQLAALNAVIPAGTVVSFNRYHASNSGDVQMTLQFYRSPDPRLTPKKRGGKGKGPMRFYVNLDEFNSLGEMEPFDEGQP
jgi:hypothetical protein